MALRKNFFSDKSEGCLNLFFINSLIENHKNILAKYFYTSMSIILKSEG